MSYSKKRAAVVVPTAFLVALSGLVAAPAAFADETEPQAIVTGPTGTYTVVDGATFTGPRGQYSVRLQHEEPAVTALTEGNWYWVRRTVTDVATGVATVTFTEHEITTVAPATTLFVSESLDARTLNNGDTVKYELVDAGAGETARLGYYSGRTPNVATQFATLAVAGTIDDATIRIQDAIPVSVAPGSAVNFEQGVTGQITYNNLGSNADGSAKVYVAATDARVIDDSVTNATPGTTNVVSYLPTIEESGAIVVRLYEVNTGSNAWIEAAAADVTEGGSRHRLALLRSMPGAVANNHNVTVTAKTPQIRVADNYVNKVTGSTATDRVVVAGSQVSMTFHNLPEPAEGTTDYVLTKTINGVADPAFPARTIAVTEDPAGSGLFHQTTAVTDDITAAESGKTIVYTLRNLNGTALSTEVTVELPTAALKIPGQTPVMVGDNNNAVEFSGVEGDRYFVVETITPTGQGSQYVVHELDADTVPTTVALTTTQPGTLSYQLYYVPTGVGMDDEFATPQVAWLEANAVKQLATPFTVNVGAVDARVVNTPVIWDEADFVGDLVFTFENLDEIDQPATSEAYVWVKHTDAEGNVWEGLANNMADAPTITPAAPLGATATPIVVTFTNGDLAVGDQFEVTLFWGEQNVLTRYSEGRAQNAAAQRFGAVKSNAGAELSATSIEVSAIEVPEEPEEPGNEQFFFQAPNAPEAFRLIPDGIAGSEVFVGDWDGDGVATPGYRVGNRFFLASDNTTNATFVETAYGQAGDRVYIGDWDGDGTDTPSVRRGNAFHLKNDFSGGDADIRTDYGWATDEVLVGDWNGDGKDTPSVRRGNAFHLKNDFSGGPADIRTDYGRDTDEVYVGDWDGNGTTSPGVRRGSTFHLKNDFTGGAADVTFVFGEAGEKVLVGKFVQSDSKESVAIYRPTSSAN